jgi:hypothetical protein
VSATLLPIDKHALREPEIQSAELIGRLEVVVRADRPCLIRETIDIALVGESRMPDTVKVIGEVVEPVEAIPPEIALPRHSSKGPIYSATCAIRSTAKLAIEPKLVSAPSGITVDLAGDKSDYSWIARVTWDPATMQSAGDSRMTVQFAVKCEGNDILIDVPIWCRVEKP